MLVMCVAWFGNAQDISFPGPGLVTTLIPFLLINLHCIESISAPLESGEFFHSDTAFF